jgi:protein tyrosine phosphatase (PTP) superfamily phosphohydrolase (DUF442 family)
MSFLRSGRILLFLLGVSAFAESSAPGIKNFYQVDEHVFRGAQPTVEGFQYLAKNGVKTIIDLRESDARASEEQRVVTTAGMKYINVPMTGLTPPTSAEITKILQVLEDNTIGPVFVHCKRGADRTGAVIAAYRIQHDHWENARALSEAMSRGMSFFQYPRQGYIKSFHPQTMEAKADTATPATSSIAGTAGNMAIAVPAGQ